MKPYLACLPALASCATGFVVRTPPFVVSPPAVTAPVSARRGSKAGCLANGARVTCSHRRETRLQGKKAAKEDGDRSDDDEDGDREDSRTASNPLWGREMTMVIGQDKISYMALGGDRSPAVLYLPAFDAPAHDYKADSLRSYCEDEEYPFISMEWFGVGDSEGRFEHGTISRWKQDAITLIDKLLPEAYQEVIIVGGGVGGWIATLIALERPEKVGGIVGLAADPDFTENLLMRYLPKAKIDEIYEKGVATIAWGERSYPVSKVLIEDAKDNLVLEGPVGGLPITCPVRLIHGLNDEEVPYTVSLDLSRRIQSSNVNLYLVKTASHHLDKGSILKMVINSLEECIMNYVPQVLPPKVDSI
ncbi:unnamed protein product [Ectocarpus sp. CCAP 1310/34]|nr:unnamed protein product [Ectocarpus sp. CCAP 1310/34]